MFKPQLTTLLYEAKSQILQEEFGQYHKIPCINQCTNIDCGGWNGCSLIPHDVIGKIRKRLKILCKSSKP
jgi:hypothetical protein